MQNEQVQEKMSLKERVAKNYKTVLRVWHTGGFKLLKELLVVKFVKRRPKDTQYVKWIKKNEKDILKAPALKENPLISVVIPVYNVSEEMLTECIESVLNQTYKNWQLCLADDASTWDCVKKVLANYEDHPQVKIVYRKENGHISQATNSALEAAEGEYVAFMDCDDTLSPNALYEVAKKINENPKYDFIYSDEDKIDEKGVKRFFPHFKAEWSPDTLMSMMYTSHLGVYRRSLVEEVGGLRTGLEGAQDYDLTLRVVEKTTEIGHIPKVLYHWRERKESTSANAMAKPYVLEAQKKAKEEALSRRGLKGEVVFDPDTVQFTVNYMPAEKPLISIIIPSKDNFFVYSRCVTSIIKRSSYPNYEIVTIDNGSDPKSKKKYEDFCKKNNVKYVHKKETFNFSAMCNKGVANSKGELLLFLNDDTEVITRDWLERMAGQALLAHTGAVGAKLYYPKSKTIQHCGVINRPEGPSHILCQSEDDLVADFGRNRLCFNYAAVTGACLMMKRDRFEQVGGFDESLPVAYNDVDLCFKLIEAGYYNTQRNDVHLYHYESLSRGQDDMDKEKFKRLVRERKALYDKHPMWKNKDPFFRFYYL